MRKHTSGGRAGGDLPSKSPGGTPTSSGSKGKWPVSPSPGATPGGSSKKARGEFLPPTSSTKPSSRPLPPPPERDQSGPSREIGATEA
ncbi:UNVERIFIED_CONTAM: hypothetical protein Slati_3752300 [Sesamum latifolium]|uniref:Uncharacterized protein n=1 Tax=Sesamum latifolium TaxID=2727402 RepID=A0AAW2U7K8_9LAMI